MQTLIDVASWAFMVAGCVFMIIGAIGMLRLPDFYTRIHAAGMTDSFGAPLVLVALMLHSGFSLVTVKLITVWIFLWLSSPSASQALAKAAYARGVRVATRRPFPRPRRSSPDEAE